MNLEKEERQKINLLSDGELYRTAVDFAKKHKYLKGLRNVKTQLSGLENITRGHDLGKIINFAKKKAGRETLHEDLREFYGALSSYLFKELPGKVEKDYQLNAIPENATRTQKKEFKEKGKEYAYFLAKEFIQHLVAEINYQRSQ